MFIWIVRGFLSFIFNIIYIEKNYKILKVRKRDIEVGNGGSYCNYSILEVEVGFFEF